MGHVLGLVLFSLRSLFSVLDVPLLPRELDVGELGVAAPFGHFGYHEVHAVAAAEERGLLRLPAQ